MKICFFYLALFFILQSCSGQPTQKIEIVEQNIVSKSVNVIDENNGIIYFSNDKGKTWKNASKGLPQKIKIGLGGISASSNLLAISTKENGIFVYNFSKSIWENIPVPQQIIDGEIGPLIYFENMLYLGTQFKGVFISNNNGKTWENRNANLKNLTIRRFYEHKNKLFVCTNGGFYSFNPKLNDWRAELEENNLQVNSATIFNNAIYLATNKGIFHKDESNIWKNVLVNNSVHNISSVNGNLYGMTYTSLLLASFDGTNWHDLQNGLPKDLYTFNVIGQSEIAFAGQWDGVYKKSNFDLKWEKASLGLPEGFAVTNLKAFKGLLVASTAERKLK